MDNIRETLRQFRGDASYLDSPISPLQRPADFRCDLMDFVDPEMRLRDYISAVSRVSAEWRVELDREHPIRGAFPAAMRTHLFAEYDVGWDAYCAHMRKQLSWFS
ncbi:hypothetical protein [Paraburkholderia tropica]|nr:hypothetical protein [Paraburkholderia tropica]RQN40809.1 hypothetical protein EHZ25_00675 [Paraburkholderia tropica]